MNHTKIITPTESYPVAIINPGGGTIKRAFDIILSGIGIVVSFPVWVLSSIAIIMESGGPILISQERVGKDGWIFHILKFRSMDKNAHNGSPMKNKKEYKDHVTRVGKILRATAMDEFPQLLSIFKGDMSFVGPRPFQPDVEIIGSRYKRLTDVPGFNKRCGVKPGLTGIAQVFCDREAKTEKKVRYDLLYIKKQSFLLDLKLILLSFLVTFGGGWESTDRRI